MTTEIKNAEDDFNLKMIEGFSQILNENKDISRAELLSRVGKLFTELKSGRKNSPVTRGVKAVVQDKSEDEDADKDVVKDDAKPDKVKKESKKAPKTKVDGEKRPLSAYQLFRREHTPIVKEREHLEGRELFSRVTDLWNIHKAEKEGNKDVLEEVAGERDVDADVDND